MRINLHINGASFTWEAAPGATLLDVLRTHGIFGVKDGGCQQGECGACAVLMDGRPVNSCRLLAAQAEDHDLHTIESLGEHPDQGWKKTTGLDPIQRAFIETGAIQCGYCTPAQVIAAHSLLERNLNPNEDEVREVLSGVLCRCTGYLKPVQAVLRAAAIMRGEVVPPVDRSIPAPAEWNPGTTNINPEDEDPGESSDAQTRTGVMPKVVMSPQSQNWNTVGHAEPKVDAIKLVQGKPAYTEDIELRGMLVAKVLQSPVAHALIKRIDATKARALPGVAAVLTWQDIPRVVYSTAGQSDPIPGPLDMFSLDNKVRFVGDRVAFVAAETEAIAEKALELIDVDYEPLAAILDSREAMQAHAPRIHNEPEYVNFADS
ncbi:MAG: 2Fe-2S iron-sulfur cluster-binding protein, partial [Anaerolineaceae bacterium]|nr:2Fe-2S iron-sulfur cluster-binding protein [Anaerolineaceae bacterium]